ncbi:MAG: DUF1508 domain-containing protein [Candidatus Bathyarchaeota archaeon]|nr:MAG: DUF1508 domain-containing protein [Candidatus Bathyarchaeota archaeon]
MTEAKFQVYKDKNGKYRFLLRDPSNKIVTISEPCETKAECLADVEAIKQYHAAAIEDLVKPPATAPTPPRESPAPSASSSLSLILHDPVTQLTQDYVIKGTDLVFTGQLVRGTQGISGVTIQICDSDRSYLRDDILATGVTDTSGAFQITWTAKDVDWFDTLDNIYDTVEVYAKFPGTRDFPAAVSKQYTVFIREKAYL